MQLYSSIKISPDSAAFPTPYLLVTRLRFGKLAPGSTLITLSIQTLLAYVPPIQTAGAVISATAHILIQVPLKLLIRHLMGDEEPCNGPIKPVDVGFDECHDFGYSNFNAALLRVKNWNEAINSIAVLLPLDLIWVCSKTKREGPYDFFLDGE